MDFLKIINLYLRFCKLQNTINICRLSFQCFKLQKKNTNILILLRYSWRKVGSYKAENTLNICRVAIFSMLQIVNANAKNGIEIVRYWKHDANIIKEWIYISHLEVKYKQKNLELSRYTGLSTVKICILFAQILCFFSIKCWFKCQIISRIHFRPP